jgi:hypothetical protein
MRDESPQSAEVVRAHARALGMELIAVSSAGRSACSFVFKNDVAARMRSGAITPWSIQSPQSSWRPGNQLKQVLSTATLSVGDVLAGCGPPRDPPELGTGANHANTGLTPSATLAVSCELSAVIALIEAKPGTSCG